MNKKSQVLEGVKIVLYLLLILVVLVFLVVFGAAVFFGYNVLSSLEMTGFDLGGLVSNTITNEFGDTLSPPDTNSPSFHIGNWYLQNFPTYISVRSTQCSATGGNWISEADRVGCYNIPSWNSTSACASSEIQALRYSCLSLRGVFACNANQVSCEV